MAERIQKSKTTHEKSETPDTAADAVTETGEKIKADIDDLRRDR
ncbi:MAG: hypothetical protein P8H61_00350 [Ilumatobacter sp.]|nr:hypothetical protein [Ilumatobacter sp.]